MAKAGSAAGHLAKRSFTIQGHRTSVALEPAFWRGFDAWAAAEGLSANALMARIDEARAAPLASAIRVALLERAQKPSG
jgi:predicted DNA-binding ribbon-helix-helix protein